MSHDHTHAHPIPGGKNAGFRLGLALSLTFAFVFVEIFAGLWGNSLALLTDAAHNFTDVIALGLSWYAIRIATRPAHARKTFGYHRSGILVALFNAASLGLISFGIFSEAWQRFQAPPEVDSGILIWVGSAAFIVNLATAWMIKEGSENDLNLRSAFLHLMGDVLSTLGAVAAGVVILFTGWNWLDPLVSVLIGGLILWNAWGILRQAVNILLESTPSDIDMEKMLDEIRAVPGVESVHDLHVWSITENMRMLSAHIVAADQPISAGAGIQAAIRQLLAEHYQIEHATLQLECACCTPGGPFCEMGQSDSQTAKT
ncbi:MAG: cation diffusion facilitator family transporter [Anaerolineales bacterium]|jgi:cobalt-zinc-cadmium efflux system protein|nr:cation diffusion facilitator family transporter [Anaerolineales bacterium]